MKTYISDLDAYADFLKRESLKKGAADLRRSRPARR